MGNIFEKFLRNKAALQIADAIQEERSAEFKGNRNAADYIRSFLGLKYFFEYVASLDNNNILDIGAGDTTGIAQLSRSEIGTGLAFFATVLRKRDENVANGLGKERTFRTPVETLKGLKGMRVGGVLALNSVAYSAAPELAIEAIDDHLVPGGILKATFLKAERHTFLDKWHPHEDFSRILTEKGYAVIAVPNRADKEIDVLVAVKGSQYEAAQIILAKDLSTWTDQYNQLSN